MKTLNSTGATPAPPPTIQELTATLLALRTMPFEVVLIEWLNEAVNARKAHTFIKEKGLYSEFLAWRENFRFNL